MLGIIKKAYPITIFSFWLSLILLFLGVILQNTILILPVVGIEKVIGLITAFFVTGVGTAGVITTLVQQEKKRSKVFYVDKYNAFKRNIIYVCDQKEKHTVLTDVILAYIGNHIFDTLSEQLCNTGHKALVFKLPEFTYVKFVEPPDVVYKGEVHKGLASGNRVTIGIFDNGKTVASLIKHELGHVLLEFNGFPASEHHKILKEAGL